jgi:Tol biopolymer transport system component
MKLLNDPLDRLMVVVIAILALTLIGLAAISDSFTDDEEEEVSVEVTEFLLLEPNGTVQIRFSEAMSQRSVQEHLSIEPPMPAVLEWEEKAVTLRPSIPLSPDQTYTLILSEGSRSIENPGHTIDRDYAWTFQAVQGMIYTEPAQTSTLWYMSIDDSQPEVLFTTESSIFDYAPSPDGTLIAISIYDESGEIDLWLVNHNGENLRQITDCSPEASCTTPAWSPDGQLIAYERQEVALSGGLGPKRIWVYNMSTGENQPVYEDSQVIGYGPVWVPNPAARILAFYDADIQSVRVIDLTTGEWRLFPSQLWEIASFSPDGEQIVYPDIRWVDEQLRPQLWIADVNSEIAPVPLLEDAQDDQNPVWSPDGEWIAFSRRDLDWALDQGSQLALYNVASEEVRYITEDRDYTNLRYRWDAVGKRILIQRYNLAADSPTSEIWYYDTEDDRVYPLVENGFDGHWFP